MLGLRTESERRRSFTQLTQLAANVPAWNLNRPLNVSALDDVVSSLAGSGQRARAGSRSRRSALTDEKEFGMKKRLIDYLVCPSRVAGLQMEISSCEGDEIIEGSLVSAEGNRYPIRDGIPRFVSSEEYTDTFGFQWNRHSRIYFDNKDKHRIFSTQAQLERKLSLTPENTETKKCSISAAGQALTAQLLLNGEPKMFFAWI